MSAPLGRSGVGARFDAPEAPAEDLLAARRATAAALRALDALPDAALALPSGRPGASHALIVAELGYGARRLACSLAALRGAPDPEGMPGPDAEARGATLPPRALRHLFAHAAIHLDVEWRDLPGALWGATLADGTRARDTPLSRARALEAGAALLDPAGRRPASASAAGAEGGA